MSIFGTIGFIWIMFTAALGTLTVGYFTWQGASAAWRQRKRGAVEEGLDIRRQASAQFGQAHG